MGTASASIEKGSPLGVITAANTTMRTMAHLRHDFSLAGDSTPASSSETRTTGNSNVSPKTVMSATMSPRYLLGS